LLSSTCGVLYNALALILSQRISMPHIGSQYLYFTEKACMMQIQIQAP